MERFRLYFSIIGRFKVELGINLLKYIIRVEFLNPGLHRSKKDKHCDPIYRSFLSVMSINFSLAEKG